MKHSRKAVVIAVALGIYAAPALGTTTLSSDPEPADTTTTRTQAIDTADQDKAEETGGVTFTKVRTRLTFEQKIVAYNSARPPDEQLYCRRDTLTGSHKKQLRCITLRDRQIEEQAARDFLRALR